MEEGFPDNDAYFEARKAQLKLKEPKGLVCESKNKVVKMCFKSSCTKTSLFCDKKECPSCKDEHKKCPLISLDGIVDSINKHQPTKKYIVENLGAIENKFFQSLKETSNELGKEIRFAGIGEKSRKIAEQIFDKSNAKDLKGKQAAQFYENIEEYAENKLSMDSIDKILNQYDKTLQNVLAAATEFKQNLCDQLNPKAVRKNINLNVVKHQDVPKALVHKNPVVFESKILSLSKEYAEVLKQILSEEKVQRVQRLYRASEHGFSAKAFHNKCDNREDTLILIRTEFGKTIGGYTHYPWDSGSGWVSDSRRRSFLFSLDMREKFVPQGDGKLIFRQKSYGPTFGGGHDIYIADGSDRNSSTANFPETYNRAGGYKLEYNTDTFRKFSGGDTSSFKVEECEVFRLWDSDIIKPWYA